MKRLFISIFALFSLFLSISFGYNIDLSNDILDIHQSLEEIVNDEDLFKCGWEKSEAHNHKFTPGIQMAFRDSFYAFDIYPVIDESNIIYREHTTGEVVSSKDKEYYIQRLNDTIEEAISIEKRIFFSFKGSGCPIPSNKKEDSKNLINEYYDIISDYYGLSEKILMLEKEEEIEKEMHEAKIRELENCKDVVEGNRCYTREEYSKKIPDRKMALIRMLADMIKEKDRGIQISIMLEEFLKKDDIDTEKRRIIKYLLYKIK